MKKYRILFGSLALIIPLFFVSVVSADFNYQVQRGDTLFRLALRFDTTVEAIRLANQPKIQDVNLIYAGDVLVIPSESTGEPGTGGEPYVIQYGDTLYNIAWRYNTTVSAILAVNPQIVNPNRIFAGATITIPVGGIGGLVPTVTPQPIPANNIHIVRPGDGLTGIARTYGTTVDALLALNPQITNRHLIFVGDEIRLR